jgi:hypothetical protein
MRREQLHWHSQRNLRTRRALRGAQLSGLESAPDPPVTASKFSSARPESCTCGLVPVGSPAARTGRSGRFEVRRGATQQGPKLVLGMGLGPCQGDLAGHGGLGVCVGPRRAPSPTRKPTHPPSARSVCLPLGSTCLES